MALGGLGRSWESGFPQDYTKALKLYHRAAELGNAEGYTNIGYAYSNGEGVEIDEKKAVYYYELAAIGGSVHARYNLGNMEIEARNYERALRHYTIAVRDGESNSLNMIQRMYSAGHATKQDYTNALQSYQSYLGEIKSSQRDEAAQFDIERYRYY